MRDRGGKISVLMVAFAACGVTFYYRHFAKIQVGPLFILEFILVLWGILSIGLYFRKPKELLVPLWAPALFFLWGALRLVQDLIPAAQAIEVGPRVAFIRVIQHSLMFIYPLAWTGVGVWLARAHRDATWKLLWVILILNVLPHFTLEQNSNLSIGPLIAIPIAVLLERARQTGQNRRVWLLPIAAMILGLAPFWKMWLDSMQRTTLVLFMFMAFVIPPILHMRDRNRFASMLASLKTSFVILACLIAGCFATSKVNQLYLQSFVWDWEFERKVKPLGNRLAADLTDTFGRQEAFLNFQIKNLVRGIAHWRENLPLADPNLASAHFDDELRKVENRNRLLREESEHPPDPKAAIPAIDPGVMADFLRSFQHGDDAPDRGDGGGIFQGRFRKFCWKKAIEDWSVSPIAGIGFVPEVPSWVGPTQPNVGGLEGPGAPPVAGPHNSYLTILARLGIIGALIFAFMTSQLLRGIWNILWRGGTSVRHLLLVFIPINGLIHAVFNVGLESPHNSMVMWLFWGVTLSYSAQFRKKAGVEVGADVDVPKSLTMAEPETAAAQEPTAQKA